MKTNLAKMVLTTILVVSMFFVFVQTSTSGEYDPWIDSNDDGEIDIFDAINLAAAFGTSGTPINKTALLLELQARIDALNATIMELQAQATCVVESGEFDGVVNADMVEYVGVTTINFQNPFTTTEKPGMIISVVLKHAANGLTEGSAIKVVEAIKGAAGNWTGFDLTVSKYSNGTSIDDTTLVYVTWIAIGSRCYFDGHLYTFSGSLDGPPFEVDFPVEWAAFSKVEVTATGYKYNTMDSSKQGPLTIAATVNMGNDTITFDVWDVDGNEYGGAGWAGNEAYIDFILFGTR